MSKQNYIKLNKVSKIIKETKAETKRESDSVRNRWRDKRKRSGWMFSTLTWVTQIFIQGLCMYVVGMFTAMSIVPVMIREMFRVSVQGGYDMSTTIDQIGHWGFPALFATLALFFAYVSLMILLWRGLNKLLGGWRSSHRERIRIKLEAKNK